MAIDDTLWSIRQKIYRKLGDTRATEVALEPLAWYIGTGRAPLDFERRLKACTERQLSTVAGRLIKYSGGDFQCAINSVCQYIGFERCA